MFPIQASFFTTLPCHEKEKVMRQQTALRTVIALTGLVGIFLSLSACATVFTGSHQHVTLHSNPDGAIVKVDGRAVGNTPLNTSLKKASG